jgi:hypothetical protein
LIRLFLLCLLSSSSVSLFLYNHHWYRCLRQSATEPLPKKADTLRLWIRSPSRRVLSPLRSCHLPHRGWPGLIRAELAASSRAIPHLWSSSPAKRRDHDSVSTFSQCFALPLSLQPLPVYPFASFRQEGRIQILCSQSYSKSFLYATPPSARVLSSHVLTFSV